MKKYLCIFILIPLLFISCEKVLDIEKLDGISPDDVWNSADLSNAYLNNIYAKTLPSWPDGSGNSTDEAVSDSTLLPALLGGTATIEARDNWPYDRIREINFMFPKLEAGNLPQSHKDLLKGQALFIRAWLYFNMVKGYGGVPIILDAPDPTATDEIFIPRNKTSECIEQIVADLNEAAKLLGDKEWDAKNIGRVDKCVALAFKGRVLHFWASPLFNTSNDKSRWIDSYNANKEAVSYATSKGKGLYENYRMIWTDRNNKEGIFVRKYKFPDATFAQHAIRPMIYSRDAQGNDQPSLNLVNAFPMKDGSAFDPAKMPYNKLFVDRDDRFYTTIAYNGAEPYLKEMFEYKTRMWTYIDKDGIYADAREPDGGLTPMFSKSGFFRTKGLDPDITKSTIYDADTDWMEIRFAEILMNMGEAANEIDKQSEALDVLYQIRKRAGILAGTDNKYGIKAVSKDDIREAYFNEQFVEFAFEGKRWDQLRRLRKFDYLRNQLVRRSGLRMVVKQDVEASPMGMDDPLLNADKFTPRVFRSDINPIVVKDEYYFYAIPKKHLDRNSKLEQTKGWNNGTFDPIL